LDDKVTLVLILSNHPRIPQITQIKDYVEFQPLFSPIFFPSLSTSELSAENTGQHSSPAFSAVALTTQTSLWLKTKKERDAGE
jgi:hypothetical protein